MGSLPFDAQDEKQSGTAYRELAKQKVFLDPKPPSSLKNKNRKKINKRRKEK